MNIHMLVENTASRPDLTAEHGLSLLIDTPEHRILFDMGQSAAFADNAAKMGLDLSQADLAVISHGHYDHGGGLPRFLELNAQAPVYTSRLSFMPHFNGVEKYIGLDRTLAGHPRLRFVEGPVELGDGISLYPCSRNPAVPVESWGLNVLRQGSLVPDDFRHEIYLMIRAEGKKILFSGCSHRGIYNIVSRFRPDVLVGGFHLKKYRMDDPLHVEKMADLARALLEFPTRYYTCHCTGLAQYDYLRTIMGERLSYLSAGAELSL